MSTYLPSRAVARGLALILLLALGAVPAFSLDMPSRKELRERVLKKIAEIREMTPTAKERAKWRAMHEEAVSALDEAAVDGAPRYMAGEWEHAKWLCGLSAKYGKKGEYRKAQYLAKMCRKTASEAADAALKSRNARMKELREKIDSLYVLLRRAVRVESISRMEADRVRLRLKDLENALALEEFGEVEAGVAELEPRLRALASRKEIWGL